MRPYRLALLALAVVGAARAAPAPFRVTEPAQAEVNLSGYLRRQTQPPSAPMVLASRAAYLRVAQAWGITNPPAVDFRTHFVLAFASEGLGGFDFEKDGRGGLRVVELPPKGRCCDLPAGAHYQVRSFPRSAVKTVNGAAVPIR